MLPFLVGAVALLWAVGSYPEPKTPPTFNVKVECPPPAKPDYSGFGRFLLLLLSLVIFLWIWGMFLPQSTLAHIR